MADIIACPNCESKMNAGSVCPECAHDDGGDCTCDHCLMSEEDYDDGDE